MRLPKAVSMRNGHLFERPMLEPATNASDGSALPVLPTPRVSMHHGPSEAEVLAGDPNSRLETAIEVLNRR